MSGVVDTPPIEDLASFDSYVIFRCKRCTCINVAWKDSEKYVDLVARKVLNVNLPLCTNHRCNCHSSGGDLQGKLFDVGKEAPF